MNPLEKLWIGRCNVYNYQEVTDPITFQTTHELVTIVEDEPCRLSHNREQTTDIVNGVAVVSESITLFIRPDLTIEAGSVIEITQHDETVKYKSSSKSAKYTNHQEIILELYEVNV